MKTKATYLLRKSVPAKISLASKKYKKVAVIQNTLRHLQPTLDALILLNISGKIMCKPEVEQKFFKDGSGKWILNIQKSQGV